jgi:enoyl-CoA hydratase/carnithine racemase
VAELTARSLTGRRLPIGAAQAHRIGLADDVLPGDPAALESALVDTARERLAAVPGVEQYRLWPAGTPRIGVLPFAERGVPYACSPPR